MIDTVAQNISPVFVLFQQKPKLFLTLDELTRDHPVESGTDEVKPIPPLFITDVQHLLLYALQGVYASIKPR